MFKYFLFLFFFVFINNTNANNKTQIIENLEKTKNLSFEFEQNINGKIENQTCIKYGIYTVEFYLLDRDIGYSLIN